LGAALAVVHGILDGANDVELRAPVGFVTQGDVVLLPGNLCGEHHEFARASEIVGLDDAVRLVGIDYGEGLERSPEVASAVMTHPYTRIVFRVGELPRLEADVDLLKVNKLSTDDVVHESATLHERWPSMASDDRRHRRRRD
jgi:hypothetical protein